MNQIPLTSESLKFNSQTVPNVIQVALKIELSVIMEMFLPPQIVATSHMQLLSP